MLQEISPHTGLMGWGFSCHPRVLKTIGSRITILRILLESNIKLNLQLCFSSESVPSVLSQVGLKLRVTKFLLSLTFRDFLLLVECMSNLHGGHLMWCALGGHTGKVCWSHFLLLRRESGSCCLKGSRLLSLPFHQWPFLGLSYTLSDASFLPQTVLATASQTPLPISCTVSATLWNARRLIFVVSAGIGSLQMCCLLTPAFDIVPGRGAR